MMNSTHVIQGARYGFSRTSTFDLHGSIPPEPRIALIGSRAAQRQTMRSVAKFVAVMRELNCSLVSGGAIGIDSAAHRAALAANVPQLVVLPCGAERVYPEDHRSLFESIARRTDSGVLFALPRGTPLARRVFASRNRIVLGFSRALVVAEAWPRSGSLQTGRLALKQNLPVSALSSSPGCLQLIIAGAYHLGEGVGPASAAWLGRIATTNPEEKFDLVVETAAPLKPWPPRLQWLRERIYASGQAGFTVDQCEDLLQAVCALTDAQSMGLVREIAPGRYLAS